MRSIDVTFDGFTAFSIIVMIFVLGFVGGAVVQGAAKDRYYASHRAEFCAPQVAIKSIRVLTPTDSPHINDGKHVDLRSDGYWLCDDLPSGFALCNPIKGYVPAPPPKKPFEGALQCGDKCPEYCPQGCVGTPAKNKAAKPSVHIEQDEIGLGGYTTGMETHVNPRPIPAQDPAKCEKAESDKQLTWNTLGTTVLPLPPEQVEEFSVYDSERNLIVSISAKDGSVTYGKNFTHDEAAKEFWRRVSFEYLTCKGQP